MAGGARAYEFRVRDRRRGICAVGAVAMEKVITLGAKKEGAHGGSPRQGVMRWRGRNPGAGVHPYEVAITNLSRSDELCFELDRRGRQRLRNRAAGLGGVGNFLKFGVVDPGNLGFGRKLDLGDLEAVPDFLERDGG